MTRPCKKVSFINEKYANEFIDKLKETSVRSIKPCRAYLCDICLTWHLTSTESKETYTMILKDRQIANLKKKVENLRAIIVELKSKEQ